MAITEVSLSSGIRTSLFHIQENSALIQRVQQRLSSGKTVNSALDNPTAYFAAVGNVNRAADLLARKDDILEGIQTVRAGENGIEAISSLLDSMKGIASAALATSVQSERNAYALNYTVLQKQVTGLANDSGYRGTNLLNTDTLTIQCSEKSGSSTIPITGFDATADGLGIGFILFSGTGGFVANQTATFSGIGAHQANVEFTAAFQIGNVSQTTIDDSPLQVFFNTDGRDPNIGIAMTMTASPVVSDGVLTVTGTVSQTPVAASLTLPQVGTAPTFTKINFGGSQERTFPTFTNPANISGVYIDKVKQEGNYLSLSNSFITLIPDTEGHRRISVHSQVV